MGHAYARGPIPAHENLFAEPLAFSGYQRSCCILRRAAGTRSAGRTRKPPARRARNGASRRNASDRQGRRRLVSGEGDACAGWSRGDLVPLVGRVGARGPILSPPAPNKGFVGHDGRLRWGRWRRGESWTVLDFTSSDKYERGDQDERERDGPGRGRGFGGRRNPEALCAVCAEKPSPGGAKTARDNARSIWCRPPSVRGEYRSGALSAGRVSIEIVRDGVSARPGARSRDAVRGVSDAEAALVGAFRRRPVCCGGGKLVKAGVGSFLQEKHKLSGRPLLNSTNPICTTHIRTPSYQDPHDYFKMRAPLKVSPYLHHTHPPELLRARVFCRSKLYPRADRQGVGALPRSFKINFRLHRRTPYEAEFSDVVRYDEAQLSALGATAGRLLLLQIERGAWVHGKDRRKRSF